MNLKDILAISGEGTLFKFIAQGKNAVIVENLETGRRISAGGTAKVSALEEISIFTTGEDMPLAKVMDKIWEKRPLDILVNNAAGQILAQTHKMSSRAIDAVLGIVLHGSAYCTVAAGRRWIEAGERNKVVMSILTVSSLTGAPFTVVPYRGTPQAVADLVQDGDVVLCMGAGTIGAVAGKVVDLLQNSELVAQDGRAL